LKNCLSTPDSSWYIATMYNNLTVYLCEGQKTLNANCINWYLKSN